MDPRIKDHFVKDAGLFPHMLDVPTDRVLLSRLNEDAYRKASFLDQRILTDDLARETVQWEDLARINLPPSLPPFYIFHIGHVGSTLISRLLGEHPDVLALREPHILRSLAEISHIKSAPESPWSPACYEKRITQTAAWLSRTFRPEQRSLIKASSFVSDIAGDLLGPDNKAIVLTLSLENYLAGIFAGEGSRQEARQLAAPRITRLTRRLGGRFVNLWELPEGPIVALGWLTEMITLTQTIDETCDMHVKWQDFDGFLNKPAQALSNMAAHLDVPLGARDVEKLVNGPIMRSYSKAPEHDYSSQLRQDLLRQARQLHSRQIHIALDWVTSLAKSHTEIETLLHRTS